MAETIFQKLSGLILSVSLLTDRAEILLHFFLDLLTQIDVAQNDLTQLARAGRTNCDPYDVNCAVPTLTPS